MAFHLSKDHRNDFPVVWKDRTLYLSGLTVGIREAFCQWLLTSMLAAAKRAMGAAELREYMNRLMAAPPTWGVLPDESVTAALNSVGGQMAVTRLLLNVDDKAMSDDELAAMMAEKGQDPVSDFMVGMALVRETADPKAKKPAD